MSNAVIVLKDEDNQRPIPTSWRKIFTEIVEALKDGDFQLKRGIPNVRPISIKDALRIANNVQQYGAQLTSLPEESWQTSTCQWMRSYWDVLIDLYTVEEGPSDLVLSARVYEENSVYVIEIQSLHVP